MFSSTRPCNHSPDYLPTNRSVVDEYELIRPALNSNIFNEEERQRQEEEEEEEQDDWGYNNDNDNEDSRQLQQEVKDDMAATLTEITFRPHSIHYCSFTAVIRDSRDGRGVSFSQLAQLIESVSHIGKIDDFTIKPMEQHSFLLTGFSRHTSSRLSSGTILSPFVEANLDFDDAPSTTLQHSKAVNARALLSEESEPLSSDESGLSDGDPDLSSDDSTCSSKKKQGSSTRMNIPWKPVDEQRLLAYKKEDKSWEWIFKKFPGRTAAAVRTRWTMVQHRVK